MLLSLVGERFRRRHQGARLAFAYKQAPRTATTLRKLSRFKYGVASKQSKLGNTPEFIETLCNIDFLCWLDSGDEDHGSALPTLESRVASALNDPDKVDRYGVLCLGLSDDAVNDVHLCENLNGEWHRLLPTDTGEIELPVWVDHVGAANTRWQRFTFEPQASALSNLPGSQEWSWINIRLTTPSDT
jgi:CRISPR-associated protein Cas5t